ncbi:MAG: hypothetical protein A2046_00190 [Bacteroidetes bacterium GWA2_30_7]|nr:MAG: hypothetical protein A2046_00190 [Bacteroidetes bacterium GWA2_30_7]
MGATPNRLSVISQKCCDNNELNLSLQKIMRLIGKNKLLKLNAKNIENRLLYSEVDRLIIDYALLLKKI